MTHIGEVASYYYLDYRTVGNFQDAVQKISSDASIENLVRLLSNAIEFSELPVRHNEDEMNLELSYTLPWPAEVEEMDNSHTKAFLLLQAHFFRKTLPISDYINDTKSVLDQIPRVLNALIDIIAEQKQLVNVLNLMKVSQMVVQGLGPDDPDIMQLPQVDHDTISSLARLQKSSLVDLIGLTRDQVNSIFRILDYLYDRLHRKYTLHPIAQVMHTCRELVPSGDISHLLRVIGDLPGFSVQLSIRRSESESTEWKLLESTVGGASNSSAPYSLAINTLFDLQVSINRTHGDGRAKAYSPRFHKPKIPSWWLILGHMETGEVLGFKRIGEIGKKLVTHLEFLPPNIPEERGILSLFLVADGTLLISFRFY